MDRIINIKVGGNHLSKDSNKAGTRGEANVTTLRITFGESWDGYAKSVLFLDAHGMNPTRRTLGIDLLENRAESTRIYLLPIPKEPLGLAGEMSFSIEGYIDGKRQRSVIGTLEVDDAVITDTTIEPAPTPTEELQVQIDIIKDDIQKTAQAVIETKGYAESALASLAGAQEAKDDTQTIKRETTGIKEDAEESASNASKSADLASQKAQEAEGFANKAENALGKTNYIGANGNWYAWDSKKNDFYDTGVRAQSGSEVYVGDNPPASADVWINPNGEGDIIEDINELKKLVASLSVRTVTVTLLASAWVTKGDRHEQIVTIDGTTPYSKVDLQPSAEQLIIFYEKDIAFVTENVNGVISVLCLGQKPTNDYVMQATITEVAE